MHKPLQRSVQRLVQRDFWRSRRRHSHCVFLGVKLRLALGEDYLRRILRVLEDLGHSLGDHALERGTTTTDVVQHTLEASFSFGKFVKRKTIRSSAYQWLLKSFALLFSRCTNAAATHVKNVRVCAERTALCSSPALRQTEVQLFQRFNLSVDL